MGPTSRTRALCVALGTCLVLLKLPGVAPERLGGMPVAAPQLRAMQEFVTCNDCPDNFYRVQPCAPSSSTPTCAECKAPCAEGEEEVKACTKLENRECRVLWPEKHRRCQKEHTVLTVDDLKAMTGDNCGDCNSMVEPLNKALEEALMSCPFRIAAFVAQVRHSTAGFTVFSNNEVAGAIHLTNDNFRIACRKIPDLKQAFVDKFTSCKERDTDPCSCGTNKRAADVVAQLQYAFRVGVWWFYEGASLAFGEPCGDLRLDADRGLGGAPVWTTRESPGVGFQKTTTCINGFGDTHGRQQQAEYFALAIKHYPDAKPYDPDLLEGASTAHAGPVVAVLTLLAAAAVQFWHAAA